MEKIPINSVENFNIIKELIFSGKTSGHLKKFYGIPKKTYENIKEERIQEDGDYIYVEFFRKTVKYQVSNSLLKKYGLNLKQYKEFNKNAKIFTLSFLISKSKKMLGKKLSEKSKEKIRSHNLGRKHSEETIIKLSEMFSGEKNPSKFNNGNLAKKHISKNNPERWEEIKEKIRIKSKKNYSKNLENKIHMGKLNSSKYGSKAQIKMFKYLKKYFNIFYKKEVIQNSNLPYSGRRLYCDIVVPEIKLAIEWDGILHYRPIFGEKSLKKTKNLDLAKNILAKKNNWTLIRYRDTCKGGASYPKYLSSSFRELVSIIKEKGII